MKLMRKLWIKVKDKETLNLVLNTLLNEYLEKDLIESFGIFDNTEKDCDFLDDASFFVTFEDKFDYIALCQSISEVFNTKLSCYLRGEVFYFDENHHLLQNSCCDTFDNQKDEKGCLPDGSYCSNDCFCNNQDNKDNCDDSVEIDEQEINQSFDEGEDDPALVEKERAEILKILEQEWEQERMKLENSDNKRLTGEELAALFATDSTSNQFKKHEDFGKDTASLENCTCKDDSLDLFNFSDKESNEDSNYCQTDLQTDTNQSDADCNCNASDLTENTKNQKKCVEGCLCKCCLSENSNYYCECDDCFCGSDLLTEMDQLDNDSFSDKIHEYSKNFSDSTCEYENCTCKDNDSNCQTDSCAECSECSWEFDENFDYNEVLGYQDSQAKENNDENLMDDGHHFNCVCEYKTEGEKEMCDSDKKDILDFKDNESINERESLHDNNSDYLNKIEPDENIFENFDGNEIQNDNFWDEKIEESEYENAFSNLDEDQNDLSSFGDEDYNFEVIDKQEIEAIKEKDLITADELEKIMSYNEDNFSESSLDDIDLATDVENDLHESNFEKNTDIDESKLVSIVLDQDEAVDIIKPEKVELDSSEPSPSLDEAKKSADIDESKLVSIVLDQDKSDLFVDTKSDSEGSCQVENKNQNDEPIDFEAFFAEITEDQTKPVDLVDEKIKSVDIDESKLVSIVLDQNKLDELELKSEELKPKEIDDEWSPYNLDFADIDFGIQNQEGGKTESEILTSLESEMKEFFANIDSQVNENNDSEFDKPVAENENIVENISILNELAEKNDATNLVVKELEPDIISFSDSKTNFEASKTTSFTSDVSPEKIVTDKKVISDLQRFLSELKLEKEKLRKRKENLEKRTSEIKSMFHDLNNGFLN